MNITTVSFKPGTRTVRAQNALYQWDYGQILKLDGLELPPAYEVHFSNEPVGGGAKGQIGSENGVLIPDEYLESGEPVYAFVFLHSGENDGETEYVITIPVNKRPRPQNAKPSMRQQTEIESAIAALNAAVTATEESAAAAADSAEAAAEHAEDAASHKEEIEAIVEGTEERINTLIESGRAQVSGLVDDARTYANSASASASRANTTLSQTMAARTDAQAASQTAQENAQAAALSKADAALSAGNATAASRLAANSASSAAESAARSQALYDGLDARIAEDLSEAKQSGMFDGADGRDGKDGKDGIAGDPGAYFTPVVSQSGVLSWTNSGGLPNPESYDLVSAVLSALPYASGGQF